ncbi:MAG: glycosyltransferase [Actinomycetia bacterium]|nr:glycosyltransferase [Actinomycetes bacterium]
MAAPPPSSPETERPPRIAFIGLRGLPADLPKAGGGESGVEEIASRLVLRGYDVTVYCRWHYNRRPSSPYKGIRLISLPSIPTKGLDNVTHSFLATLHVAFADTADIIQYCGMGTALFVPLAKLLGKRSVVAMDGIDWERPKWGPLARFALRLGARTAFKWADAVHVDNAVAQRHFHELFGKAPELITLAAEPCGYPGSDSLAEFGLEKNRYVLFVGLLKPDKGVHTLTEAYAGVETQVPLVIVGDSPDPGDYVRCLKSTPDKRIRFLGYVYGPKVKQLFANCLLYVQPSLMEGNSPALMTAMACGRAVVVSDIEQNMETIGGAGASFVRENPESLARVLTALIADPQEMARLGELARARIETTYNWDRVIDQTDGLFRRIPPGKNDSRSSDQKTWTTSAGPLDHAIGFWKPAMPVEEIEALARYCDPEKPPSPGVDVWRTNAEAGAYRVVHGAERFSLYAAVHPIEKVPDTAEAMAEIFDRSGRHHSYVLWFPHERAVVLPFDPNAAIEAFWYERYITPAKRTVLPWPLLRLYYTLKPVVPSALKAGLRRLIARRAQAYDHFLEWPTDRSLDLLQRLLLRVILVASARQELAFAWFWPDGHPWAAILTHDVETAAGLAGLQTVADMERQRGLRSSFNLVPLDYEISEPMLRKLHEDGFEVGVHGLTHDGLLFSNRSTFLRRVPRINEYGREWKASGFRSPATYRNQDWFHMLEFEYDSSVSNSARFEPQPGGCASFFPFPVGGLLELPITLPQDQTLLGLLGQTGPDTWLANLREVRDANGMACVLTHPDPANGYIGHTKNAAHYPGLLDALVDSGAWIPLPRDLARWWRARAAASPGQFGSIEGMSFGKATLDSSGHVLLVPPVH